MQSNPREPEPNIRHTKTPIIERYDFRFGHNRVETTLKLNGNKRMESLTVRLSKGKNAGNQLSSVTRLSEPKVGLVLPHSLCLLYSPGRKKYWRPL